MTTIHILAAVLDAGMAGVFVSVAVTAGKIHEGPVRIRIAVASAVVAADLAAAAAIRFATGEPIPIWYVPIYGMVAPVAVYAVVLHLSTIRARMRVLRERIQLVDDELARRLEQRQAKLVRAQQL